jgi:hypothetical protein
MIYTRLGRFRLVLIERRYGVVLAVGLAAEGGVGGVL